MSKIDTRGDDKLAIVRVHHPKLTKEEYEKRTNEIKKALIQFYKETTKEKKS